MKFTVKDAISEEGLNRGLRAVIKDGLCSHTMGTLTGGVFLVAFALKLNASNSVIGLIAAIPPLMHIMQIPSIYLVEKIRVRRAITVFASAISRTLWLLIAMIPFIFDPRTGLFVLVGSITLNSAFAAVGGCSWNSWMRDLIPQDRLGAFYSKRMALSTAFGIIVFLASGYYLAYWKKQFPDYEIYSYSLLFTLGFVVGILGVYFISTIPEPGMERIEKKQGFFTMVVQPFKDPNFKRLIIFLASWNFAVNLAAPFFTVYLIKRLEYDMKYIIALTVLCQVTNLLFLRIWGRVSDRFNNKSVLSVCAPLFIMCIFAWTFTTFPEKHAFTMPLLILIHIFMGIALSGVTLASGNISMKLAPKGKATTYMVAQGLASSMAAFISPIIGGQCIDYLKGHEFSFSFNLIRHGVETIIPALSLSQWDFFFVFASIIGLYSIHRLAAIIEIGEVEEKIVISELISEVRRGMRNFSTVGGLRYMLQIPFVIIRGRSLNKKLDITKLDKTL